MMAIAPISPVAPPAGRIGPPFPPRRFGGAEGRDVEVHGAALRAQVHGKRRRPQFAQRGLREDVLSGVLLHVIEAALAVNAAADLPADEGLHRAGAVVAVRDPLAALLPDLAHSHGA